MKCKYCQAEMEDGATVCPLCNMEQELPEDDFLQEQEISVEEAILEQEILEEKITEESETKAEPEIKEAAKATPGKIALAIAAGVVVLALLVALIINGLGSGLNAAEEPTTAPTEVEETVPATIPPDGNPDDVTCKGSYTVTDDEALACADDVVATMGDVVLTNGQLQVYYWEEVYAFLQETASYGYFGLDFTKPLDVQMCEAMGGTMTWQQYFLDCAINVWHGHQALALEARDAEIQLDQETMDYINGLAEDMEQMAQEDGYADAAEMIAKIVGAGPSVQDYVDFAERYHYAYAYISDVYAKTVPTAEEVEQYFAENESAYAESGITKDMGKYVDVRHILLTPQGGTVDENGVTVYSDEEWEACRVEAQSILDQWLKGDATEQSFAMLANEHSEDPGSNTNGGLYTRVYEGQMVESFNDWCFDEQRQVGDSGLVKTNYGYHVMYFVGSQDIWYVAAEYDLIGQTVSAVEPAAIEKYPVEIDFSAIKLALVELA